MKKLLLTLLAIVAGLAAIFALMFTAMDLVIFDAQRYETAYQKYDVYEDIQIAPEDLTEVTQELLKYMRGNREDLVMYAQIQGTEQMVFEEREQLHMVDVLHLFLSGFQIRNYSAGLALGLSIVLILIAKKEGLRYLMRGYLISFGLVLMILVALGIYALVDFSDLFWNFHLMFFDNDLWLLNPETDVMIQMFPEAFFFDMTRAIGTMCAIFVGVPAILCTVGLTTMKRIRKQSS